MSKQKFLEAELVYTNFVRRSIPAFTMKEKLLGMTLEELKEICLRESLPAFTAKQICNWLYIKRVSSFDQMTNLSLKARKLLGHKY